MNPLKQLAGQTALYGIPTILGRLLNYLLVPLYTRVFLEAEYGVVAQFYSYSGFLLVLFTYGMETAFFRFFEGRQKDKRVFSTGMYSLLATSLLISGLIILLADDIARIIRQPDYDHLVVFIAVIIGLDALSALPFAKLRAELKAKKFAIIRSTNILINIGLNLFFLVLCPAILESNSWSSLHPFIDRIYDREFGIGYIFLANLAASGVTFILLSPQLKDLRFGFRKIIWREMFIYALPLILVGLAGIINETIDRILLKFLLPHSATENDALIGIYSAAYKLSILMTLFIQAFRYAAEPFFFAQAQKENPKPVYAMVLKYFTLAGCLIFLGVMLYLDIIKYFIGSRFHDGLHIVPVLLLANLFLGIYYSLSIWYKLTDRTNLGALVAVGGAVITVTLNFLFIPVMGYEGAAWTTLICYLSMALAAYFIGQHYYPVPYQVSKISGYISLALILYGLSSLFVTPAFEELSVPKLLINTLLLLVFIGVAWRFEKPVKRLREELKDPEE